MESPVQSATRPKTRRRITNHPEQFKAIELIQRGRMILDVAAADLAAANSILGPFHETSWFFRSALTDARKGWDRLRAQFGITVLENALQEPPATILTLRNPRSKSDDPPAVLIIINGATYRVEPIEGTIEAPHIYRVTRIPDPGDSPYYACRLLDRTTQCDCAEWTYRLANLADDCKHLAALDALGWI